MPDNDGEALLSRQSKRRRVDIGVKRTAAAAAAATGARETLLLYDAMNQSHPSSEQGGDCSLVGLGLGAAAAANGEVDKSNVLRKLLKRANSYEDSIISQLLKNNMGKNGGTDSGFQGSGTLSSGGSEIQGEDVCSNPSSRDQDSPSRCLSFSPSLAAPPPSSSSSSTLGRPPPPPPPPPPAAPPPPARSLCTFDLERLTDEHLRAKRARVENIIRGMSHSPLVVAAARSSAAAAGSHGHHDDGGGGGGNHGNGNSGNSVNNNGGIGNRADCVSALLRSPGSRLTGGGGGGGGGGGEGYRENKRKQRLPQQQHSFSQLVCSRQELRQEERRQLKLQLEDMQKQLRQLQEKFYQIYDSETEEEEKEERPGSRGGGGAEEDGNLSEADSLRSDGLEERRGGGAPSGPRHRRRHDDDDQGPPPCSSSSVGDLDPGVFLDRARALLQGRALMGGGPEMEEEEEEEEEYEEERQAMEEERSARKRRAAAAGGAGGGGGRHLAETLKQELNCAVSQVVDSVVKGFASPKRAHAVAGAALRHGCHGDAPSAAAADAPPPLPPPPSRSSHSSQSNASPSCAPPLYGPLASLAPDLRFTGALGLALHAGGDMSPHPPSYHSSNQRLHCFGDVMAPGPLDSSPFGAGMPTPTNDQTEALSLVVRKGAAGIEGLNPSLPAPPQQPLQAPPPHQHPSLHPSSLSASLGFGPASFRHPFPLPLMGYPFQGPMGVGGPHHGYPGPKEHHMRSSPDSMDMARETVSLRSKMAGLGGGHLSHHHHHHHHHRQSSPSQHGGQEGLSLALIKSECGDLQDLADISPYSGSTIQEGLSPNHLKKAKLMFFYTRYPSSNMLKMFFSDVKFNRCITSQLIKWFSNFREFYYIQMEKFARQAINEGVASADELSISRDAELYRALNMHYNKANDFQVPERFLEVAQVTLREFFNAIVAGKDVDPSWKKAIYKVICKLDSDVPDVFKSPSCLQELLHD